MNHDKLVTAEDLGRRLSVRASTIRRWAREGRIPAVRPTSRVIRFDLRAALDALRELRLQADGDRQEHFDAQP